MNQILSLFSTMLFCLTLLGMACLAALAVPGSSLPSLVVSFAKWCEAAINAVKKNKNR